MRRQAIETKYLGPTTHKGARVKAKCQAGSVVVSWNYKQPPTNNHYYAACQLADKFGWNTTNMIGGGNAKGDGYCFVFTDPCYCSRPALASKTTKGSKL